MQGPTEHGTHAHLALPSSLAVAIYQQPPTKTKADLKVFGRPSVYISIRITHNSYFQ